MIEHGYCDHTRTLYQMSRHTDLPACVSPPQMCVTVPGTGTGRGGSVRGAPAERAPDSLKKEGVLLLSAVLPGHIRSPRQDRNPQPDLEPPVGLIIYFSRPSTSFNAMAWRPVVLNLVVGLGFLRAVHAEEVCDGHHATSSNLLQHDHVRVVLASAAEDGESGAGNSSFSTNATNGSSIVDRVDACLRQRMSREGDPERPPAFTSAPVNTV